MRRLGCWVGGLAVFAVCGCGVEDRAPEGVDLAARAAHTATALPHGAVLVAGGCVTDGCATATSSTVLLSSSGMRRVAAMAHPRDAHTATPLRDGGVLVVGGFPGEGEAPLTSAERFDPGTGRWSAAGDLRLGRGGHAAAALGDGRVLIAGGWIAPRRYTRSTEIFDPASGAFTRGPGLSVAADGLAATPLPDGRVLLTGGQVRPGVGSRVAQIIAPSGTLRRVAPMRHARFKHTMLTLSSGKVLVLGGTRDDRSRLRSTELFDPATGHFSPGPTMLRGRYKLSGAAAELPDGRVVVAGGGDGVELLDPERGSSTLVARAGQASFSTVSVVGNTVRVLGGYDEAIRLTHTQLAIPLDRLPTRP